MPKPLAITKNGKAGPTLLPTLANRHGCINGATGTGKTATLQTTAHAFSNIGVPVFMADAKGDLSGTVVPNMRIARVKTRLDLLRL